MNTASSTPSLCVVYQNAHDAEVARRLADDANVPVLKHSQSRQVADYELQLRIQDNRIDLYSRSLNTAIDVDFCTGKLAHRKQFGGGKKQAIARATGLHLNSDLHIIDATAGLASDAFVLASLGCRITLLERSPILCALVQNAIDKAKTLPSLQAIFDNNFLLHQVDSKHYLNILDKSCCPDVIYLDPMFPHRKKSALVKKEMQILQKLHGADDNAEALLEVALQHANKRVVVKRPVFAPPLEGRQPATAIKTKNTRYDIYPIHSIKSE